MVELHQLTQFLNRAALDVMSSSEPHGEGLCFAYLRESVRASDSVGAGGVQEAPDTRRSTKPMTSRQPPLAMNEAWSSGLVN